MDRNEIASTFRKHNRNNLVYPGKLGQEDYDKYDELIAVWTDYILEYKGLLKSKTKYKESALKKYRKSYATLKK